jgi:hypothetical protein
MVKTMMVAAVCLLWSTVAFSADLEFKPHELTVQEEKTDAKKDIDYAEAAKKLRALSDKGDLAAKVELGYLYFEGKGVPKDDKQAAKLFRQAAEKGNSMAQGNLGKLYQSGTGVKKDPAEAVKWFRLAAEQGNADAQTSLGLAYTLGDGVPMDKVEGLKWVMIAADKKHKLANLIRNQLIREATKDQALKAEKLSKEWKPQQTKK